MIDRPIRRTGNARDMAESAFKAATTKPVPLAASPAAKAPAVPLAKELVSIRIDRDVLERFQGDGPGWQDRMNAALRASVGLT